MKDKIQAKMEVHGLLAGSLPPASLGSLQVTRASRLTASYIVPDLLIVNPRTITGREFLGDARFDLFAQVALADRSPGAAPVSSGAHSFSPLPLSSPLLLGDGRRDRIFLNQ